MFSEAETSLFETLERGANGRPRTGWRGGCQITSRVRRGVGRCLFEVPPKSPEEASKVTPKSPPKGGLKQGPRIARKRSFAASLQTCNNTRRRTTTHRKRSRSDSPGRLVRTLQTEGRISHEMRRTIPCRASATCGKRTSDPMNGCSGLALSGRLPTEPTADRSEALGVPSEPDGVRQRRPGIPLGIR